MKITKTLFYLTAWLLIIGCLASCQEDIESVVMQSEPT